MTSGSQTWPALIYLTLRHRYQPCYSHTYLRTHTHTRPLPHVPPRHSNLIRLSDGHFPRQGHRFNDISYQSFSPLLPTHVKHVQLFIYQGAISAVWLMSSRAKENHQAVAEEFEGLGPFVECVLYNHKYALIFIGGGTWQQNRVTNKWFYGSGKIQYIKRSSINFPFTASLKKAWRKLSKSESEQNLNQACTKGDMLNNMVLNPFINLSIQLIIAKWFITF